MPSPGAAGGRPASKGRWDAADRAAPPREGGGLRRGLLPPLGVAYVASSLEAAGHCVRLVDAPVLDLDFDDLVRDAVSYGPSLIGISAMTPTSRYAYRLAERLKEALPGTPIVLGGAHAICYPMEALERCPQIDCVVTGEGETAAVELAGRFAEGRGLDGVRGIAYRGDGGAAVLAPPADPVMDLDTLPFPARRHFPIGRYAPEPYENRRLPSTNIVVARGCTWSRCTFCERSGPMKRRYRIQSPGRTIEEIKGLVADFGVRELVFYDDDLMSNAKWILEFSELVVRDKLDILWACRAISNGSIRPEVLRKAKEAGLWALFIGFESGDQELLDRIRKGIRVEQSLQVSRWCHEIGIEIIGSFILGLPGETPAKGRATIQFAKDLDVDYAAFIPLHPFEGTPLYAEALREGRFVEDSYDGTMNSTRFVPRATYVPAGYGGREEVERMVRRAYREFYLRPRYLMKHLRRLRSIEDIKRYWSGFSFVINMLQ